MDDSILNTIKEMLGLEQDDPAFDVDLLVSINTYLKIAANQFGIGKKDFTVDDASMTWSDFLNGNVDLYQPIKSYLYIKCRNIFDPSASSAIMQALKEEANELSWRLIAEADIAGEG